MPNRTINPKSLLTPITACARASYAAICKDAMAYLLMAHLQCFYCGCRSAQKQDGHIRKWQCEKCQAVNHLDENGEITDPPAVESASEVRYAQNSGRSISTILKSTDSTLFCPTCLKNQSLLTQNLADYLPALTDPRYPVFEASYPAYKESLEQRYPPVCEKCEPGVLKQLQATSYAAKADYLGRMTARTRAAPPRSSGGSGGTTLLTRVGALCWWASFIGQVFWNIMGALSKIKDPNALHNTSSLAKISTCLQRTLQDRRVDQGCAGLAGPCGSFALTLGVLSIWWNPLLKQKSKRRGGRMLGLSEYYKVQLLALVVKFAAWYGLEGKAGIDLSPSATKGAHVFALAFTVLAAIASFRAVRMDYTPQFSFLDTTPKQLVARNPETAPSEYEQSCLSPSPPQSDIESFSSRTTSTVPFFPIDPLAPGLYQSRRNSPTPPPDGNDTELMDWTPTQKSFQPNLRGPRQRFAPPTIPSPFHRRLPPAPICQAHKLRNRPNPLTFHRTPPIEQQNFFNRVTGRSSTLGEQDNTTTQGSDYPEMAPPKFFPDSSSSSVTGLESLFSGVFSLTDEPPEVRVARQEHEAQAPAYHVREPPPSASIQRIMSIVLLSVASVAWTRVDLSLRIAVPVQVIALTIAAAVAGKNLVEALNMNKVYWVVSDILLFSCELAAAISVTGAVTSATAGRQEGVQTVGPGLLILLAVQEIWLLISAPKTRKSSSLWGRVPPNPTQPLSSQLVTTDPLPPVSQHTVSQQLTLSTPSLQSQSHSEARTTRSVSNATTAVGSPSSSLSGLSLGGLSGMDDGYNYGAWSGGRRGSVQRSTERAWERGAL